MKTRRGFMKALLGAALAVPAVAACRTLAPVELPAETTPETMLAAYRDTPATRLIYQGATTGRLRANPGDIDHVAGKHDPLWLDYNRGPSEWKHPGVQFFPHGPSTWERTFFADIHWDSKRHQK